MSTGAEDSTALALIISAGSGAITLLLGFVVALVSNRAGRAEKKLDDLETSLNGRDGTWSMLKEISSWAKGAEARIKGLEDSRLTAKEFESATKAQNDRLEGLKLQTEKVELKVDRLALQPPPRSYSPPENKR